MALQDDSVTGSSAQFAQLLAAINKVETNVDAKLSQMKRELVEERESADDRLVKKMRLEKRPVFKKISHEKQFDFNEQVRDKVESAVAALELPSPAVEKARTLLKEGEKHIDARQKNIKIADRSEHGWATVQEYEEDELADNSDDEKRLFRAETRAGRKLKQKNFKNAKKRSVSRKPVRASWWGPALTGGEPVHSNASALVGILPRLQVAKNTSQGSGGAGTSQLGPCYMCGKMGHYRRACPLLLGVNPSKSI